MLEGRTRDVYRAADDGVRTADAPLVTTLVGHRRHDVRWWHLRPAVAETDIRCPSQTAGAALGEDARGVWQAKHRLWTEDARRHSLHPFTHRYLPACLPRTRCATCCLRHWDVAQVSRVPTACGACLYRTHCLPARTLPAPTLRTSRYHTRASLPASRLHLAPPAYLSMARSEPLFLYAIRWQAERAPAHNANAPVSGPSIILRHVFTTSPSFSSIRHDMPAAASQRYWRVNARQLALSDVTLVGGTIKQRNDNNANRQASRA